ncbi:MAG TPA: T9SS type A sorting domain-containing protein [Ferruginibacter sp.]|nr:T9SS type A sorting domain-containing protein [Ferruginibacter sp.]
MRYIYFLMIAFIGFVSPSFAQITSTASGGDWSNTATWVGAVVPGASDDVIIADGATVTIDVNADALSVVVGQGVSGSLVFQAAGARTLTVSGNVTIASGASFQSAGSGAQTGHELFAGGNLTNNGILDFSTNADNAGAGITFTGAANATFSGSGSVTDVLRITVDKGTDATSILELNTDVFTFTGSSNTNGATPSFLDILNGTFKLSGSFTMTNPLFTGTGAYTIPSSGGLWLNNANFIVSARSGTANVDGTLQVDAGTLNIGTAQGHRLGYIAGTAIIINGGTINLASRFSATSTFGVSYTQTGGTFNLNTVANTSAARATFDIQTLDNSSFTMSGGRIVLQNASTAVSGPRDFSNNAVNMNITGGTLQIGNASSGSAQTFFINGSVPDLEIDNAAGGHTVQLFDNTNVLNTLVKTGATLILNDDAANGFAYTQQGATLTNSGTIDGTAVGSQLIFAGTAAQTYDGDGNLAGAFASLEFNNPLGVTIANTIPSDITTENLIMSAGDITTGVCTLTLGTSDVSIGTATYVSGTIVGKFKRWYSASTIARNFPVGVAGITRTVNINFTTAPTTGGTLTAEFISLPGGENGLPLIDGIYLVTNSSGTGYWRVTPGDGLTGGNYTGTFRAAGFNDITDFSQLVLLKRNDNSSPWILDGTHVPTTGSNASAVLSRTGMTGFSEFGVGGTLLSLPISIEYFKGSRKTNGNQLDWKVTCTNTPGLTMELERSEDSRRFTAITNITATAVRCLQPFDYTDNAPKPGMNYYRLRMTDADGNVSYSQVVSILNKDQGFSLVSFSPNPVTDMALLNVASANNSRMEILVTDLTGKKVMRQIVQLAAGSNQVKLNLSKLANGSYQVTGYTEDGEIKTLRFVKN